MDAFNTTLLPSAHDLLMVFPRIAQRAGAFAFHYAERLDGLLGMMREPGTVIADPTVSRTNATITNTTNAFIQASSSAKIGSQALPRSSAWYRLEYIKQMGGLFNYMFSKWSIVTLAIVSNASSFFVNVTNELVTRLSSSTGSNSTLQVAFPSRFDGQSDSAYT